MNDTLHLLPGIYPDVTDEKYHADLLCVVPTLSSSLARTIINRSPRHAWWESPRLNPDHEPQDRKTFDIGRAAHRVVLGKGSDYAVIPESVLATNGAASTSAAKDFIAAARAEGRTPIKPDEAGAVHRMAEAIQSRLTDMRITLPSHRSEITAVAEVDGAMCRARIDHAPADTRQPLVDLKTTTDASPEAIQRAVMNYGYDTQAAHYCDVWRSATGEERDFQFIFVEKDAPHEVSFVRLNGAAMVMGRKRAASARALWRDCLSADHWPGYPAGVIEIDLPEFYQARFLEREALASDIRRAAPSPETLERARRWQAPQEQ